MEKSRKLFALNLSQAGGLKVWKKAFMNVCKSSFKSHPDYKVFRKLQYKNKTYTMDPHLLLVVLITNGKNGSAKTEDEMNPNRMFNKQFFDELNEMQEVCGAKKRLLSALNRFLSWSLIKHEESCIDIRQIWKNSKKRIWYS